MAGSVPDVADLVVSDPVQSGVMAVMAIADTAKFNIVRQQKRRYYQGQIFHFASRGSFCQPSNRVRNCDRTH